MTVWPLVLKVHHSELENTETESAVKNALGFGPNTSPVVVVCCKMVSGLAVVIWTEKGHVWHSAWCVESECHIALCYIMMKYWMYDLVKFLSCPAQIAFHNLMRQIFFNGNPGWGHDCHDKLRIQLLKAGMHTLVTASCDLIGLKSAF